MKVIRSEVPGYDATVVTLEPAERFILRNPGNPADQREVRTVIAFDHGTVDHPDGRYFRAYGRCPATGVSSEIDHNFLDAGVLPPHVREALPHLQVIDHAPEETLNHAQAQQDPTIRRAKGLPPDQLERLRALHGVTAPGPISRGGRRSGDNVVQLRPVAPVLQHRGRQP